MSFSLNKIKECSLESENNKAQLWEKCQITNSNGFL